MSSDTAEPDSAGGDVRPTPIWLDLRPAIARPTHLLMLVAHVGAGPGALRAVEQALPASWSVFALLLPGRERRWVESPDWALRPVAEQAAAEALTLSASARHAGLPFAVAGQCSGAWLAYAILEAGGPALQERCHSLFVVSQLPWHSPRAPDPLPEDSDELWRRLAAEGDTPKEVAADPEMRELLEPIVRADQRAVDAFPEHAEPLSCPIVVVAGAKDPEVNPGVLAGWSWYTPSLSEVWLDSGHLPLEETPERAARTFTAYLPGPVTRTPDPPPPPS